MADITEEEIRQIAKKRVEARKGFFSHLAAYIIVNVILVLIWFLSGSGGSPPWFIWTAAFWGVGVVAHCIVVFVAPGADWEQREIEKEVQRIKKKM
jgi:hypothetical protein